MNVCGREPSEERCDLDTETNRKFFYLTIPGGSSPTKQLRLAEIKHKLREIKGIPIPDGKSISINPPWTEETLQLVADTGPHPPQR